MENCLICDSAENYLTSYPSGGVENPLQFTEIQTCYACEFGIALPYKNQDELDNFYQSGKYWDEGANISETLIAHNKNQAKHRVRKNRRFLLNQDGCNPYP